MVGSYFTHNPSNFLGKVCKIFDITKLTKVHSSEHYCAVARTTTCAVSTSVFQANCPLFNKNLGNLCFSQAISTNFITKFYTLEMSRPDSVSTSPRGTFRCSFLPCATRKKLLLVSVVAVACRLFGFHFPLLTFFFAPATLCHFLFRAGLPYTSAACFGHGKIAVAYYKAPCTIHKSCGFAEVWRGPVRLAVLDQCFPWEVIIEPVVELHGASLNCTVQCGVESTEDQSCVSRC